jgi:hypothetical protein
VSGWDRFATSSPDSTLRRVLAAFTDHILYHVNCGA